MTKVGIIGCGYVGGALKVTYFNAVVDYCRRMGWDYKAVHSGVLPSGCTNDTHTQVPDPDGKYGHRGKCFPKDANAFAALTQELPLGWLIAPRYEFDIGFRWF